MKKTHLLRLLTLTTSLFIAHEASALQIIEPVEGNNSFIKISAKELTRIAVENGKIRSIIATDGDISLEKDEERGQVFMRPLVLNKPVNVRVITSAGSTFSLVMQAVDMPQEDIIIRDAALRPNKAAPDSKMDTYTKTVRSMMMAMTGDSSSAPVDMKEVNKEFSLWEGTRFTLISDYTDRGYVGEKYRLENTGSAKMRIAEQELYRSGVMAVAIESLSLDPGQSTNIYIVRGAN